MERREITTDARTNPVHITTELIGHFSIDSDLQYRADLSQLKYYIPPSNPDNVNFDLNINCTSARHKPPSHITLENILRWISDNFHRIARPLSEQDEEHWLDIDFICSRGVITKLMCWPEAKADEWIICASKYHGTIYLCEFRLDERERGQENATVSDKQIPAGTNKFQQYIVADHPLHEPDSSVPLNECGGFYCMFKANFSNVSLLYSAKIDAISSQQPITDTLIGKPFESIGLKTLRMQDRRRCAPTTVIKCWSTNFLANTNRIVVGFRDTSANTVKVMKEYSMADLLKLSKPRCDVEQCKAYLTGVLMRIKQCVTEDCHKYMYKFHWQPSKEKLKQSKVAPDNEMYPFLKPWFVAEAEEYRRRTQQT